MNTSKQVNVMIGLLFLTVAVLALYFLNENNRQAQALEHQTERVAERGARIFVDNCRSCHGLEGEGGIGQALNTPAFLILGEDNEFGAPATPDLGTPDDPGADEITAFLANTITCGRSGTFMPAWGEHFGGTLSDTQIGQLVTLITNGRWDLVREYGHESDAETGFTPEELVFVSSDGLKLTGENCGQYNAIEAIRYRSRVDPRTVQLVAADGDAAPAAPSGEEPSGPSIQGVAVDIFYQATCATCHGPDRGGLPDLGLPLLPEVLTESDDFYFDTIKNGREGTVMPAWGQQGLSDDDIQLLVDFIRSEP
ncbi:MAG: c-type cytochrome [Chloroflexi bacterium]|nr:c-type cytochrome [Chloroflexota bacterium]